jgi:hypothetical protein
MRSKVQEIHMDVMKVSTNAAFTTVRACCGFPAPSSLETLVLGNHKYIYNESIDQTFPLPTQIYNRLLTTILEAADEQF